MNTTTKTERRRDPRAGRAVNARLHTKGAASPQYITTMNLSPQGAALKSEQLRGLGEAVLVELDLADGKGRFECKGRICWSHPYQDRFHHGVRFVDLTDDERDRLVSFLVSGTRVA